MTPEKQNEVEHIQRLIARHVATHPVGRNLALIGGFRYRFLDNSIRTSDDIDYHWAGDLEEKQRGLIDSCRRVLLGEISRLLGYSGRADARTGPDADSPVVRIVDLSFWKDDVPDSRIEIPVEVTRIACADPVAVRTSGGTIYATASEADMIESKVIAILGRITVMHRDIVDVFLFESRFLPDSAQRLKSKLDALRINDVQMQERMRDLHERSDYHSRATQEVIDTQLDSGGAAQLNDSGGGKMVLDRVMRILNQYIGLEKANESD
ncbi:MAG: hypothetical protein E4H02_06345 [Lentisphaerales bacterium]|jgi:hypothetical protein|nr:MAG: hypothetical protein E4H02_06345 [Lentisphaerales bacterium]